MSDTTTAPVWAVWSTEWIRRDTFTEQPPLDGLNGSILTHDTPGRRECWKVNGGQLEAVPSRLCSICREKPVGPGGQMCPDCFERIDTTAKENPYGWTEGRANG